MLHSSRNCLKLSQLNRNRSTIADRLDNSTVEYILQQLPDTADSEALGVNPKFPCTLLCCSASLLPLRLLLGQGLQWLCCACVLWHDQVMWWSHWRVDESGWTGHDKQQSPVSQWSQAAHDSNIRTCVRNTDSPGCSSVHCILQLTSSYSRVCGKVIAYQIWHH